MDTEKLISLVLERKALWDTSCKSYHNRDVARSLWKEIAELMNSTSPVVKGKWQSLRDMFRREHAKKSKAPTGSAAQHDKLSSWKCYDQLLFLANVFSPRKRTSNIPLSYEASQDTAVMGQREDGEMSRDKMGRDSETASSSEDAQEAVAAADVAQIDPLPGTSTTTFKKPDVRMTRKFPKSDASSRLLAPKKRKIEQLEKIDEDYYFLMSLLPYLREIPRARKLAVRTKFHEVLMEEESRQHLLSNYASSNSSSSYTSPEHPSPNEMPMVANSLRSYLSSFVSVPPTDSFRG